MSSIIVPRRGQSVFSLERQLDRTHPVTWGLQHMWVSAGGNGFRANLYDVAGGQNGYYETDATTAPTAIGLGVTGNGLSTGSNGGGGTIAGVVIPQVFTFEVWFSATNFANGAVTLVGTEDNANPIIMRLGDGGTPVLPNNQTQLVVGSTKVNGTRQLTAGVLYQAVGTYDGATQKIYINGTIDVTQPSSSGIPTGAIYFGLGHNVYSGSHYGGARTLPGTIPLARVWNRALSPTEIQSLYVDPYAMIQAPRRLFPIPAGGSGTAWTRAASTTAASTTTGARLAGLARVGTATQAPAPTTARAATLGRVAAVTEAPTVSAPTRQSGAARVSGATAAPTTAAGRGTAALRAGLASVTATVTTGRVAGAGRMAGTALTPATLTSAVKNSVAQAYTRAAAATAALITSGARVTSATRAGSVTQAPAPSSARAVGSGRASPTTTALVATLATRVVGIVRITVTVVATAQAASRRVTAARAAALSVVPATGTARVVGLMRAALAFVAALTGSSASRNAVVPVPVPRAAFVDPGRQTHFTV